MLQMFTLLSIAFIQLFAKFISLLFRRNKISRLIQNWFEQPLTAHCLPFLPSVEEFVTPSKEYEAIR